MHLILITKTFQPILHGPARFAQALYRHVRSINEHHIKIISEEIEPDPNHGLHKVIINYPFYSKGISDIFRGFSYYQAIRETSQRESKYFIFNNSVHLIYTKFKTGKYAKCIGMINDNENLSIGRSNFTFSRTWFYRLQLKFLESLACKYCDLIVVCSHALKELVISKYKISTEKIHVLYQGVNHRVFTFSARKTVLSTQNHIHILFIKCDYIRGGLLVLKKAILKLPDLNFVLTIAGPRDSEKDNILLHFSKVDNCKIIFLGPVTQDEVLVLMHENDLFCVPSLREGLGVANIEALSCGLPVVSSDSLGIPEVLNQGAHGWMAKAGDAVDLANQLKLCISQDELRRSKSEKGRAFVVQHFNIQENIRAFLERLEQI